MNLATMIRMVNAYVDDIIDNQDIVMMLNDGKDLMASEVRCKFPDIELTGDLSDTFVFDEQYHRLPVLYASAMIKAQDSSIGEKNSFMQQFYDGLATFKVHYDPPAEYWDRPNCQQFIAEEGQEKFEVTKEDFHPVRSKVNIYVNSQRVYDYSKYLGTIFLDNIAEGDRVTISWHTDPIMVNRPSYYVGW